MKKNISIGHLKERIKLYSQANVEIKELEIRIKELNDISISAIDYSKDNVTSGAVNSSTENKALVLAEIQEKLNKLIKQKYIEIERIENILSVLSESEREIIELKYIKNHSWETVCYKSNRSLRTVRRIEKEALIKMLDIINLKI